MCACLQLLKNHQASVKSAQCSQSAQVADKTLNFFGLILEGELLSQGFDLWPYSDI